MLLSTFYRRFVRFQGQFWRFFEIHRSGCIIGPLVIYVDWLGSLFALWTSTYISDSLNGSDTSLKSLRGLWMAPFEMLFRYPCDGNEFEQCWSNYIQRNSETNTQNRPENRLTCEFAGSNFSLFLCVCVCFSVLFCHAFYAIHIQYSEREMYRCYWCINITSLMYLF